jgi:hypothetical protein
MMNHEQYRRAVLANPLGTDPELEAHRAHCEHCRAVDISNFRPLFSASGHH